MTKKKAKKTKKEVKKQEVAKNPKRRNQTKHESAMAKPEVRDALSALRACWGDLSPLKRSEELSKLIGVGCSSRGIARELGKAARSIDRYIALTSPPEEGNDWVTMMERTVAKEPKMRDAKSAVENTRRISSISLTKKIVEDATRETRPPEDGVHSSAAKLTKNIGSHLSTKAKEPPVVSVATSGQENNVGVDTPKMSLIDQYLLSRGIITPDERKRQSAISQQAEELRLRKLSWSARSLGRQGRSTPPEKD